MDKDLTAQSTALSPALRAAAGEEHGPFYVRQCGGLTTMDERRDWLNAAFLDASKEADAPPPLWWRASTHPDMPDLVLIEVWRTRPDEEGEPRWGLTTSTAGR